MLRIAAYHPRPFSILSAPNFSFAPRLTRMEVMIMSPMTKRMKIHSTTNDQYCTASTGTKVATMTRTMAGMTASPRWKPESTKSRTQRRCGPLSRTGR